jgi:hypothetical protein
VPISLSRRATITVGGARMRAGLELTTSPVCLLRAALDATGLTFFLTLSPDGDDSHALVIANGGPPGRVDRRRSRCAMKSKVWIDFAAAASIRGPTACGGLVQQPPPHAVAAASMLYCGRTAIRTSGVSEIPPPPNGLS